MQSSNLSNSVVGDYDTTFPENELPKCWQDKARINSLFAPFRAKTANPEDWNSKLKFWKSLIKRWTEIKGCSCFTVSELKRVFKENGRSPACLEIVVEEMLQNSEIQMEANFLEPPQHSWSGWAMNTLMKKPLRWSFGKIKETVVSSPKADNNTKYVLTDTAKTQGEKILSSLNALQKDAYASELMSLNYVAEHSLSLGINSDGVKYAIHSLYCENKISLSSLPEKTTAGTDNTDTIVKLADACGKCSPVTEVDIGIYSLHQNEKILIEEINKLEEKKEQLRIEAKSYLEKNKRQMAKNCLKKKHIIDASIDKRSTQLDNVQGLLARIQESETNGRVVDSYQSGLAALKNSMKDIQPITVQDTMDEIQEAFGEQDEIQSSLGQNLTNAESESDLEDELAELILEEEEEQKNKVLKPKPKENEKIDNKDKMLDSGRKVETPELKQTQRPHDNTVLVDELLSKLPKVPKHLSPQQQAILVEEQCTARSVKKIEGPKISTPNINEMNKEPVNKLYPKLLSFDDFHVDDITIDELDASDIFADEDINTNSENTPEHTLENRLKKLRSPEK